MIRSLSGKLISLKRSFSNQNLTKRIVQIKYKFINNGYNIWTLKEKKIKWKIIKTTNDGLKLIRKKRIYKNIKLVKTCYYVSNLFYNFEEWIKVKKGPYKGKWKILKKEKEIYHLTDDKLILKLTFQDGLPRFN